jgi:hypothetical protein
MRSAVLFAGIFLAGLQPAMAQQQTTKECWEAYVSANPNDYPLLLNKCTGESYMLSPHPVGSTPDTITGKVYTWDKIPLSGTENRFPNEQHK